MSKGVTQSEFARLQKCDKAHISRLKSAGRLVLVEGKIDVDASRALSRKPPTQVTAKMPQI
jgi:hypothetical protein